MLKLEKNDVLLVTGGCGFIGTHFVMGALERNLKVINLDLLTYSANKRELQIFSKNPNFRFYEGNIADTQLVSEVLKKYEPKAIIHFAAESHVDRSIENPEPFIETNIVGTYRLLQSSLNYWKALPVSQKEHFRFLHVSTDEVYGSLEDETSQFSETSAYRPNSPYSASKAASDHLVRAWHETYGLPCILSHCSNNYGPFQHPEKLIPKMIANALSEKTLPLYGDGKNIRDWLYVVDHCSAIFLMLEKGKSGESYHVGGNNEKTNLDLVNIICQLLDKKNPRASGNSYRELIRFVEDRAGHDRRYAINSSKIQRELGWLPSESFETGLEKVVDWYLHSLKSEVL